MEGGGPTRSSGRAALRQGMERFLASMKQRAREASWHWKLACVDALASYYGRGFRAAALPRREELELEPRERLATALNKATRNTRRGAYHKIHHASDLLKRLDSPTVRSRCPSCDRLFATLDQALP